MGNIDIIAQLSDMKIVDYKNTLAIVSLIEVLIEKGLIDEMEVALKAEAIEKITDQKIQLIEKANSR